MLTPDTLEIYGPEGRPFLSSVELAQWAKAVVAHAEQEAARAKRLAERLRVLGVDPNHLEN